MFNNCETPKIILNESRMKDLPSKEILIVAKGSALDSRSQKIGSPAAILTHETGVLRVT